MNYAEEEKTIDLKQLLYYVAKRWKSILIVLIAGALLGSVFSFIKGQGTTKALDVRQLDMAKIAQYDSYQKLFDAQSELQSTSAILQMDPYSVYNTYKTYFLSLPAENVDWISEQYNHLLSDPEILQALIDASGLACDQHMLKGLVNVSFTLGESTYFKNSSDSETVHGSLLLSAHAPDEDSGEKLLSKLEQYVVNLSNELIAEYPAYTYEKLSEYNETGYSVSIVELQDLADARLQFYADQIAELEKQMTADELLYYQQSQQPEQNTFVSLLKHTIKYAILFGALLCILSAVWYAVRFLLDDHIKTADELQDYGLYTIACLQVNNVRKKDWVDRLFAKGTLPSSSREYLLNALKALCPNQTVVCGDQKDVQTAEIMNWLAAQMDNLTVTDKLACDEKGLVIATESEGAVLFVRLWKTTAFDLKRELCALRQIDRPIKGVVVLRG